ncbi:MAG: hypothetical protein IKB25_03955 [Lentisphaeria bacterium]|nr:hypothetical protein [Lentisphaeria bacterium]
MKILPKTLDEHKEYTEKMLRLSFFFARRWLAERAPEKKMSELLADHTPAFYHGLHYAPGTWYDQPECLEILETADRYSALSPEEFEEIMWKSFHELAESRAEENHSIAVGVNVKPGWNCGSLKYDPPKDSLPEGWIVFHIANAVGPNSIFTDPDYLPQCFLLLMKETELRYGSHTLYTSTWLNDRSEWLELFPQEWHSNLEVETDTPDLPPWHFGWWGQIVTRQGMVSPVMDQFVRERGRLKYISKSSHCSFEAMRNHLKKRKGGSFR